VGATSAGYAAPDGALIYLGDAILQLCRACGAQAGLVGYLGFYCGNNL
jgi:hypothetical protein